MRSGGKRIQITSALGILAFFLALGPTCPTVSAGEFLDWLLGRNQQLIPIGSYPVPIGQPVVANYPSAVAVGQVPGVSCQSGVMPGLLPYAPMPAYPSSALGNSAAPSLPVYPPTNSPTTAQMPPANFRSVWNQTPVTYYRPVTSYDPNTGATVTQLVPCTSVEYQTQRVPVYAFRPIFGQGRTFFPSAEMSWNPNSSVPVATNGSSSFISVPQSGMPIQPSVANYPGSALAGSLPPSYSSPVVPSNPIPSYLPPNTAAPIFAPSLGNSSGVSPSYVSPNFASPGNAPSYVAPATNFAPSAAAIFGAPIPAGGFGGYQGTTPATVTPNDAVGTGLLQDSPVGSGSSPSMPPSIDGRGIADPESTVQPSLPGTTSQYEMQRPRFGLSRVAQPGEVPNPFQPSSPSKSDGLINGTDFQSPMEIPSRLPPTRERDDLRPIPAPEGSDLSPKWNRGLLDARDLTASRSKEPPTKHAVLVASQAHEDLVHGPVRRISNESPIPNLDATSHQCNAQPPKTKPGRVLQPHAGTQPRTPPIDDRGWTPR